MNKKYLFPTLSLLLALLICPACNLYDKNLHLKIYEDGSADMQLFLYRTDEWVDDPPAQGRAVEEKFHLEGVEDAGYLPIALDYILARIPDIGRFRIHDIRFSKTIEDDRFVLTVRIPLGNNAKWIHRWPLITTRYTREKFESVMRTMKMIESHEDAGDFIKWSFMIQPPAEVWHNKVMVEGNVSADVYDTKTNDNQQEYYLYVLDQAYEVEGDAAIIWTISWMNE